jgi:hypothetical protein
VVQTRFHRPELSVRSRPPITDTFADLGSDTFLRVSGRLSRHWLRLLDLAPYQRAVICRGLVPEEDVGLGILEDSMWYSAILGWLTFDQLATLNERIPTWGDGHFEGLRNDMVESNERIERLERNQESLEEEVNRANDASYRCRLDMEAWMDVMEERLVQARSAIHLANVEVRHLRGVVSRLSTRLMALEHGRENPILVEDKREYPQLPVGDPGRLVEINDVSEVESIFDEDAESGSSLSEARSSPVV